MLFVEKIISGGQTGADEAALAWAIDRGIPHGGWCPRGRRNETGSLAGSFDLRETPSDGYAQRTEWNVRDSDATVIFSLQQELTGGSLWTLEMAERWGRPWIHLSRDGSENPAGELGIFLERNFVRVLNVAGPRASTEPDVGDFVREILDAVFPVDGEQ